MTELDYIIEDLKKANIKNYSIEKKHFNFPNVPNVINASNSIIYVIYVKANTNNGILVSYDFNANIIANEINESIFKFVNDILLTNIAEIKIIKVNYIKNPKIKQDAK
ncbi:MAG: hypothetical protein JXR68_12755 [Bacteroidales bacterium]|nr:hypothetical protein [Bacteroidales bacterium]